MTIRNIFSKTWLRAQYEIVKYSRSCHSMTDEQVNACVAHENVLRACCSQLIYDHAALRKVCDRCGLAYIK